MAKVDIEIDSLTHQRVRELYGNAARSVMDPHETSCGSSNPQSSCCGSNLAQEGFGAGLYGGVSLAALPGSALKASLGCGNPYLVADLHDGETVLDLGSGGGLDVILSAKRVGPTGLAYGLDMTEEMVELARQNAAEANASNVEFLTGKIEDIPLPDGSIDVIISNCVINLSPDKTSVFKEMYRVLFEGGRIGISDVVADDSLNPQERRERGEWVGCIAGALSRSEYKTGLQEAGFIDVEIAFTHEVADGMHGATIRAAKPA